MNWFIRILVVLALTMPALAGAQERSKGEVSTMTTEVSMEVYSPFCPGKTLAMCPSPNAAEVRREIQTMAEEGMSKEDIKTKLVQEYGEEFRMVEPPTGDNLGLFAAIAAGLGLAGLAIFALSRRRESGDVTPTESDNADEADPYLDELREQYRD